MRYAIIAAGEGSRLASEGISQPKPLVRVGGEPLLGRLLRVFGENDAEEVAVVCSLDAQQRARTACAARLRFMVRSTPSSMHSLHALAPWLRQGEGPVVVTTVDTVFRDDEFTAYVAALRRAVAEGYDGLMGVTSYVDDERPLYVATDEAMAVTAFCDDRPEGCRYVSAGIYGLMPCALDVLERCVARGESRMRNFQRALLAEGLRLRAHAFGKVLDVDHAADIAKAEELLR